MSEPLKDSKFVPDPSAVGGVDFGTTGNTGHPGAALRIVASVLEHDPETESLAKAVEHALRKETARREIDAMHRRRFLAAAARCDSLPPFDPRWGAGLKMQWFKAFNAILRGEDAEVPEELTAPPEIQLGPDEDAVRRRTIVESIVQGARKRRAAVEVS